MGEFQALDKFFDEHHRKWRKRAYAIFEDACGHLAVRSEYSRWLNRKTGGRQATGPPDIRPPEQRPRRQKPFKKVPGFFEPGPK